MLGRQCHASFIALHHHQFFHNWLDAVFILDHPILSQFPQKKEKKRLQNKQRMFKLKNVNQQLTFRNESKQTAVLFGQKTL